jgi:hypothetical protein
MSNQTSNIKHQTSPFQGDDFDCSHVLRLSGREWLVVAFALLALVGLGPLLWERRGIRAGPRLSHAL